MLIADKKNLIQRIINVFETGVPEGKYDKLVIYDDGINGTYQITYGRSQTTEQGNLLKLIEIYIDNNGKFADDFVPYLEKIGKQPLSNDENFKNLLIKAAREDQTMRESQDIFFDGLYWLPALNWLQKNGFELPLSGLVVYDSFVHSGGVPMFLRKRFRESPPSKGGNEKKWITSYVEIRRQWLKYHERTLLRKTIYRTQTFFNEIEKDNWYLEILPINTNGVNVF
ncbi:MAG: chitosanase [Thermodesulfovibrionales bacterium]|nr:chitosanase [Thermodesulfovibrionales bacterium]